MLRLNDDCLAKVTTYLTWQEVWHFCHATPILHRKLTHSLGELILKKPASGTRLPRHFLRTFSALKLLEIGSNTDQPSESYDGVQFWLLPSSIVFIKVHSLAALKWLLCGGDAEAQSLSNLQSAFEKHFPHLIRLEIRVTPGDAQTLSAWEHFQSLFSLSCLATTHLERISSPEKLQGLMKSACASPNLEDLQFSHELPLAEESWVQCIPRSLTRLSASLGSNTLSNQALSALPPNLQHLLVTTSSKISNPNILGLLPKNLESLDITLHPNAKPFDFSLLPRTLRDMTIRPQLKIDKTVWKTLPRGLVASSLIVNEVTHFTKEAIQELKEIEDFLPDLPPQFETTLTVSGFTTRHIDLLPCARSIKKLSLACFGEEAMTELSRYRAEKIAGEETELGGEVLLTNLDQLICPDALASLNLNSVEKSCFDPLKLFEAIGKSMPNLESLTLRGDSTVVPYSLLLKELKVCRLKSLHITYETNKSGINAIDFSAPWASKLEGILLNRSITGQTDDLIANDEIWVRNLPSTLRSLQAKSVLLPYASSLKQLPASLSRLDIAVKDFALEDLSCLGQSLKELRLHIRESKKLASLPLFSVSRLDMLLPKLLRSLVITGARWKVVQSKKEQENGKIMDDEDDRTRLSGASLELRSKRPQLLLCTGIVI